MLSLSYRPHENTVLRLLSTERTPALDTTGTFVENPFDESSDGNGQTDRGVDGQNITSNEEEFNDDDAFASLLLSLGVVYLQPSRDMYYNLWRGITANQLHTLVFAVFNGSVSSCLDGAFVEDNPSVTLWDTSTEISDEKPVRVHFSRHLQSVYQLVSPIGMYTSNGTRSIVLCTLEMLNLCCSI